MPAPGAYDAPPRNEYLIQQPRLTKDGLLTVFYTHELELARLMQASEVPQDLDPVEIARREDRWSWSVSLPMQVETASPTCRRCGSRCRRATRARSNKVQCGAASLFHYLRNKAKL
jgi:hypothetical protein